ncbi:MAG: GerMN domain-containing protein [Acidimicrobiia bacterium]
MRYVTVLAVWALVLAGCGGIETGDTSTTLPGTTTTPSTTTTLPSTTTPAPSTTSTSLMEKTGLVVYLVLDQLPDETGGPYIVPVYREAPVSGDLPSTVMEALLAGPTSDESTGTPGVSTAIPAGTTLLGVQVDSGLATVDLSAEYDDGGGSAAMFARLAQVVYTLTRLPDIDQVAFSINGEPVMIFSSEGIELDGPQARDDYYEQIPPIFVDSPAWGEPVTSPLTVSGLSNVFEAVSQVMLTDDDGAPLYEGTVMATCGTGCWGQWETEVEYEIDRPQFGALIVWEFSAKDGSRVNVREYPVLLN